MSLVVVILIVVGIFALLGLVALVATAVAHASLQQAPTGSAASADASRALVGQHIG